MLLDAACTIGWSMRIFFLTLVLTSLLRAQEGVPTFQHTVGQRTYTLVGGDPASGGTTTIPTVLVPITLSFEAKKTAGKPFVMDAARMCRASSARPSSPSSPFPPAAPRSMPTPCCAPLFPKPETWHTLLGKPEVKVKIAVPVGYGYILTSKKAAVVRRLSTSSSAEGTLQAAPETAGQAGHRHDA